MDLNQGPQPSVTDINGVRYIDPNPTDQIVNHEDLVVYVKLVAKSKGRSILTNIEDETIIIEKELKNVGENTNFTYTEGKDYIDTDWTNIGGGPSPLGTDLGGFGITNINIDFKSSFMPQIIIDFVDIRGAALFEQGPCSPYSMFFHLPYPVFELTVKGYYGKPVTYSLALTKFNTKFNAETGNFESKGEFVGYTYAFLADIPIGYILAANYMEDGPQILAEKWGKIISRPEFQDSAYGLPEQPITIFDLIVKSKKLETQLPKLKNTTDVQEVAKISKVRKSLVDLKEKVLDYGRELGKKVKTERPNGGIRKSESNQDGPATVYYIRVPKDATESTTLFEIGKINKNYVSTDGTDEGFGGGQISIELALTKATYDTAGISGAPDLTLELLRSQSSGFFGAPIIENPSYPDFDEYYIDIKALLKPIDEKLKSVNTQYKEKRKEVQKLLNDAVREILDFWPSIRNVFAIILSNTEVFLELMARTSVEAEKYHTQVDIRDGLGGSRNVLDLNPDQGASGGSTDNYTYPWPTYYETIQKTATNEGDSGEKETYPGENEQFVAWPEVIFCEDFIQALTKLRRDLEVLDITETTNEPGFDNYAPITAFETQAFDNEKAPNRWFASDRGVPGSTEIINSIYTIMGENAFILGDYSMINTLSLWKSQLGFTNGYGWEPVSNGNGSTNGYSSTEINGVPSFNQGPQRFTDNPIVNENINSNVNLGRYAGKGFKQKNGSSFNSKSTNIFKGSKNYEGSEGSYNFSDKVNPTTKAKIRHWGRIDATNLLQTLSSDGQNELLNIIKQSLNPNGQITASQLKERIKSSLKEVYNTTNSTSFKEESFTDWADSASASINNSIAKPALITQQNLWDSHFSYVKNKPVLTLTGPIELNHLETIDGDISANPWNNPYEGVRLVNKDQKSGGRTIKIDSESVVTTIDNLFKNEFDIKEDENDKAEAASGGDKTGITYASLWGKPKWKDKSYRPSVYVKEGKGDHTQGAFLGLTEERAKVDVDENLNMLYMSTKKYRTNFYHSYSDAKGLTAANGIVWDLGSSRQIYTRNTTSIVPGSTKDGVGKMYNDFIATDGTLTYGAFDAFVQTPLWTLNYPPHKLPNLATYSYISNAELVNVNMKSSFRPVADGNNLTLDSPANQFRNFATWWGVNSYYGTGSVNDLTQKRYHLPLAYLAVCSFGYDPPQFDDDYENQKTGHHIPFDGEAFWQENSFTNFTNHHVVVEPPKSWLLLLGAILWRAKEGQLLETTNYDNIPPQYTFKGWNHAGISRGGVTLETDCSNCTDDNSDPVWFFHNSISKPNRGYGTIPAIHSITDNEWMTTDYIRRYRGYDDNNVDRWTASGGNSFLRPVAANKTPTNYFITKGNEENTPDRWGLAIGGGADTTFNFGFPTSVGKVHSFGDGAQGSKGWTKSQNWPLGTGNYKYGNDKFRAKNNINSGLFDQCRQDQMPFLIRADAGKNLKNGIEFPHTLVIADLSKTRDRNPNSQSATIVDATAKYQYSRNAPNRVPNSYINLKEQVKELMFLPKNIKLDLIKYFEDWAIEEAVSEQPNTDRWLGILDPCNFDPKKGIFLGENTPNGKAHWNQWKTLGEPSQFQWGYGGFLNDKWTGAIYEGKLDGEETKQSSGGGYFNSGQQKYNIWYLAYGGDTNSYRTDTSATKPKKQSPSSNHGSGVIVGYGNGTCLVAGSKVLLSDGSYKNIEDVKLNDTPLSYNILESKFEEGFIESISLHYENTIITVTLENGKKMVSTDNHPFYVKDKGWSIYNTEDNTFIEGIPTPIKQLSVGDELYYYDHKTKDFIFIKIEKMTKKTGRPTRVWNLRNVDNNHNFIANNVLLHNKNG